MVRRWGWCSAYLVGEQLDVLGVPMETVHSSSVSSQRNVAWRGSYAGIL